MKLRDLILGASLALGVSCEPHHQEPAYVLKKVNLPYFNGFGEVYNVEGKVLPIHTHNFYKTDSGDWFIEIGALVYGLDKEKQRLLTHGGHQIMKRGEKIFLKRGSDEYEDFTPKNFEDKLFDESEQDSLKQRFEERNGGLYIKKRSLYMKTR